MTTGFIIGAGGGGTSGNGLPPSICKNLRIKINGTSVKLNWQDPNDTILDRQYLCSWAGTKIVKKLGAFPENEDDGILVVDNTTHNQYLKTAYEDTIVLGEDWKYVAFPYSTNEVVCYNKKNQFIDAIIYEYLQNPNEDNPDLAITYPIGCVNEDFIPMGLNSEGVWSYGDWETSWIMQGIYPCMVKYDTTLAYKLNKNDLNYKEDGVTPSDIANIDFEGNAFTRFPQIWIKRVKEDTLWHVYVSNLQVDDSYHCFTHINVNGELVDDCYISIYQPAIVNGVARSIAGRTISSGRTRQADRTSAQANGLGHDLLTYGQVQMLQTITILMTKSLNTQAKLGYGISNASGVSSTTGTMRTAGGFAGKPGINAPMVAYWIENLIGNCWKPIVGAMYTNGTFKYKLAHNTSDGSTVTGYNFDAAGYIDSMIAFSGSSGGYINNATMTDKAVIPLSASGSATTKYCDGLWWVNGGSAFVFGDYACATLAGLFVFYLGYTPSDANQSRGASLSCVPL